jgi:hypothetical protein
VAIFKAIAKRNDGGSSFGALVSYLSRGDGLRIGREDGLKIDYEGRSPVGMLMDDAALTGDRRPDVEPRTLDALPTLGKLPHVNDMPAFGDMRSVSGQERAGTPAMRMKAAVPMETNCLSLATAAAEMWALAAMNPRVKDPVYHFLVSLQRGERLPDAAMFDIARDTIAALGFKGHQYVAAIHDDTDNLHVHVAVNRVHPEPIKKGAKSRNQGAQGKEDEDEPGRDFYRAVYPKRDHHNGAKAMRQIELRYGLAHDKGAFAVFERDGKTVIDWASKDPNTKEKAPTKARDMEIHGRESLFSYARGEPRRAVVEALKSPALTWQELHQVMGRFGLELREKGQGFAVHDRHNPEQTPIKASDMHERLSKSRLEKQLGPYQAAPEIEQPPEQVYNPDRSPKRDPQSRAARAELRAQQRRELRELYDQGVKPMAADLARQVQQLRADYAQRGKVLSAEAQVQRKVIQSGDQPPAVKKAMLSVLAAETVKQRAELREAMKRDRLALGKVQPFKEWVADQAEAGHPAAISQLRGYLYADKRKLRQLQQLDAQRHGQAGIAAPGQVDHEPEAFEFKTVQAMTYQVDRQTGDVAYRVAGRAAFTDHGRRITFQATNDEAVILAGLKLAQQKYGQQLDVTGSAEFRRQVAAVAAKHGLRVTFTDPALEQHRQQIAAPAPARPAAPAVEPKRSREDAEQLARQVLGPAVELRAVADGATARGQIVGETAHHVVQEVSPRLAVIYDKRDFAHLAVEKRPQVGQSLAITREDGALKVQRIKPRAQEKGRDR